MDVSVSTIGASLKARTKIGAILRWPHLTLCLLVIISLGLHFASISSPEKYLFDEHYYVPDARSIISHESTLRFEHPPLGKLFIIEGIRIFGDNPFGWRFFSVIFGVASIVLLYYICRSLKLSQRTTLIVTILFTFENFSFVQASTAMLDVYCLTCMLAALLFYLREKLVLAGMCVGLSVLAKLTGAAVLGVIFLYWLITNHRQWKLLVIPVLTSMVSLLAFLPLLEFTITGEISNPVSRIEDMLQVAGSLTTAEALNFTYSPPWYWLMNRGILFYSTKPQFIAVPSLTITWLFIPAVFYMIYQSIRRNQWAWLALAWVACSYLPWVFSSLFIHRFTYIYYFYPVIPVVCLGIGFGLNYLIEKYERNKTDKLAAAGAVAAGGYIFLHLALFVLLSPFVPPLVDWLV